MHGWVRACLRVGEPDRVLPRLATLTGEHPLMESLAAAYLRVLYAAGRPADALAHYRTLQRALAEELGTDPGPELQQCTGRSSPPAPSWPAR